MMPQVGQDIETGILREWKIKVGDKVKIGDIVAVVESDKASFEVEAYESGIVLELLYNEGSETKVFEPIAYLDEKGKEVLHEQNIGYKEKLEAESTEVNQKTVKKKTTLKHNNRIISTPSARRVARENDIDIAKIKGSGPKGRILRKDILIAMEGQESVLKKEVQEPVEKPAIRQAVLENDGARDEILFSKMRQKISEKLVFSKQTIPHYYLFMDVDMTDVLVWRSMFNQNSPIKISINDIIIKATATTLLNYPKINSFVSGNKFILIKNINIGIAVSVEDGLLVPVIAKTNEKNIEEIAELTRKLVTSAKMGILKSHAIGTFTISNLGMYSVNRFLPIINPPEVAILGVGKVEKRILPLENNSFGIRDMLTLSLVCDHRAVDGTYAAKFLHQLKNFLEEGKL
jgi:pyruvate dehydrogenase E2 component (dihydrolipoamide acetyltransferase)